MPIRIVRLGTAKASNEGLRIGTVRRPPRGVPKSEFASQNWYDVWLPNVAPSPELMKLGQAAESEKDLERTQRMQIKKTALLILLTVLLAGPQLAPAKDHGHATEAPADRGIQLSPALKKLLNQEMEAIQKGMMALVPAIASGKWDEVADIGKNIKASFIMKQKLSKAQREELHHALTPAFIEMDQAFHKSAGMLAHAAEMKNSDVVNFYFFKLNEACVSCHAKYATSRFPGLATSSGQDEHHH